MSLSSASHPLLCCIITLYTLIFIYSPLSLNTSFSPLLTLTSLLLLSLLRLGSLQHHNQTLSTKPDPELENLDANQNGAKVSIFEHDPASLGQVEKWVSESGPVSDRVDPVGPIGSSTFVEWDVSAPLEVIHEAYEGDDQEDGEDGDDPDRSGFDSTWLEKYPSLSMYYPETDSDTLEEDFNGVPVIGEWESPERVCFKWDEEDDREELIEIALDGVIEKRNTGQVSGSEPGLISGLTSSSSSVSSWSSVLGSDFHVEEDNLIEIDISP